MNDAFDETATAPPRRASTPRLARDQLATGTQLGHFRIEKKLGAGGMGEVYLATDLALDRPVAIKVLPAGRNSKSAHERMVREARAQARVQHPNVAHIYFIGEDAGRLYFAMEYVTGKTLADAIAEAPLSPDAALAAVRATVLGLREAHRSGFTHRDVKPSNLMYDAHGLVKVLDFGLAAATPTELGDGPVDQTSVAGTPLYMAPEQAHGDPIDLRSDIYALGATLYHLVSGQPPFKGATMAELVTQHETAARPTVPRGSNPRMVVTALDRLIARMMAPLPADRFASYDELLAAIDLIGSEQSRSAGFVVRSAAVIFDVLIAAAITLMAVTALSLTGEVGGVVALPIVALMNTVLTWNNGSTPGKAMFELEVVNWPDGGRPTLARAFVRHAVMWGPMLVIIMAHDRLVGAFGERPWINALEPVLGVSWLVHLAYSAARTTGKRTVWDRLSKTHVRYKSTRRAQATPVDG